MTVEVRAFQIADTDAVIALWEESGLTRPWNDPRLDIQRKLAVQPELFLVAVADAGDAGDAGEAGDAGGSGVRERVVGSVMAGYDGHRGWLSYLAASPDHRGRGIGRALVERAEQLLLEMGCPKVQLMVRPENTRCRASTPRSATRSSTCGPPAAA